MTSGSNTPSGTGVTTPVAVKPALSSKRNKGKKKKGGLTWDEAKIEEHDKLRGTRMKIEEPNTPYHQAYDSGSETDGSRGSHKDHKDQVISWDHLQTKLEGVAAVREAYPSSPSSHGGGGSGMDEDKDDEANRRRDEIKALEFREHRKRHYNEMELVRKFRLENPDDDDENDADDET